MEIHLRTKGNLLTMIKASGTPNEVRNIARYVTDNKRSYHIDDVKELRSKLLDKMSLLTGVVSVYTWHKYKWGSTW